MESPKFYLVIDLEATCDQDHRLVREQTEIIELGAVLVDGATLLPVAEFQTFIKPVRHPRLTPFCTQLTSITQADVDGAPGFSAAMLKLAAFLRGAEAVGQFLFCSWGDYDREQLGRDERRHGTRAPVGPRHLNLKDAFRRRSGDDGKLGTGAALRRVGLQFQGTAHRGIDDARNIARLLPYCLGVKPIPGRGGAAYSGR